MPAHRGGGGVRFLLVMETLAETWDERRTVPPEPCAALAVLWRPTPCTEGQVLLLKQELPGASFSPSTIAALLGCPEQRRRPFLPSLGHGYYVTAQSGSASQEPELGESSCVSRVPAVVVPVPAVVLAWGWPVQHMAWYHPKVGAVILGTRGLSPSRALVACSQG